MAPIATESTFEDHVKSIKYNSCKYQGYSEAYIKSNCEDVAVRLGNHFVGSIVCFDKIKILITSLDVFFHIDSVDDCAYTNKWLNPNAFAKLHMKTEKGNNFFELSIVVDGCVELLAVGGLVVINGGSVEPFLGSSLKPLNRAKVLDGDLTTSKILVLTRDYCNNITTRFLVDIEETNLLKIKLARELILLSRHRLNNATTTTKAIRLLYIGSNLKTIDVAEAVVFKSDIREILKAAASRKSQFEITVSASSYDEWIEQLDKQKFREGAVRVLCCESDDDVARTAAVAAEPTFEDYVKSIKYSSCEYQGFSESHIKSNCEDVAVQLGNHFVGGIVCFKKVKFLITSLDVFFHLDSVDDCAYANQWFNESVFAKLHMKSEKGNNFFELSIIVDGCIELLAVSGLCSINGGSVEPFLGSSVKPLNRAKVLDGDITTEKILVSKGSTVALSNRLLRRYYKQDSCKQWSFHLKNTYDAGFFPINPLHVGDHPSVSALLLSVQSSLLRFYAEKQLDSISLATMFNSIVSSNMLIKELKVPNFSGTSFLDLYNAMTITGKWKTIIGIAKDLETGSVIFDDEKQNTIKNKKTVLSIVGGGYLQNLSRINDKTCARFKSKISK